MPTTVLTQLDALTGPTTVGILQNMTDSAANTMGCNLAGSDGLSGSMVSSTTKQALIRTGPDLNAYVAEMTMDFDGALISIPANAQIYKIEVTASVDASGDAIAIWGRTGGVASGSASGSAGAFFNVGGTFTPTTTNIPGDDFSDTRASGNTSFSLGGSLSVVSQNALAEFVFEPPGTNIQAPLGYINRGQLVAQFTNVTLIFDVLIQGHVTTGVGSGTYTVDANGTLVVSGFVMRVFWNPGYTVTDIIPDPAPSGPTPITIEGTDLDTLTDLSVVVDGVTFPITPTIQTTTTIVFTVDPGVHVGTAVIFSGSVELGSYTIYLASGSGIYRIVPNKRNDTLYERSTPGNTVDVAIPEPFGETGFIGG